MVVEEWLIRYIFVDYQLFYWCEGVIVYCMVLLEVDYYFFFNDGEVKQVELDFDYKYWNVIDVIIGEFFKLGVLIELECYSGCWLCFEK